MFSIVAPLLILFILIMVLANFKHLKYNEYSYPDYADGVGWAMTLSAVLMIPGFAIYELSQVWKGIKTYKVSNHLCSIWQCLTNCCLIRKFSRLKLISAMIEINERKSSSAPFRMAKMPVLSWKWWAMMQRKVVLSQR